MSLGNLRNATNMKNGEQTKVVVDKNGSPNLILIYNAIHINNKGTKRKIL